MQDELFRTYNILSRINDSCRVKVITQEELNEQDTNLKDFQVMITELGDTLSKLENSNLLSVDETVETLLQLHLKYSDYIWHIDQIHELVKKMAGNYRDSN
ncbi:hypothetical protein M5X00_29235 [Paenibacillus alvei]|uniref:Uncharacterized protein n=1 Tax=Paenibacillus alvei TaxID=44250 RepID=A0ABT4H8F8_PAEAL|nr:hypothetical protein [Paenibacillus alvei]EJW16715.1 hypothetical protein PAV_5c02980 [Paenibacillus alvei DSM 29]MBG9736743.1 hypothetical protein [Paenibacillus alvei]MBG9746900.1 hypothetical protein [Paenibacillus alvei]MCY9544906.1 hypothetical protein [Paenibacillus alvei]MCY9583011.1 hypothetical protein [Paenibacillus alvei]